MHMSQYPLVLPLLAPSCIKHVLLASISSAISTLATPMVNMRPTLMAEQA